MTGPLREGAITLGEVDFVLTADDTIRVNSIRLIDALRRVLRPEVLVALQTQLASSGFVTPEQLEPLGYRLRYDAETIGLVIDVPGGGRPVEQIRLTRTADELIGAFDPPARFAGYVNFRSFTAYTWSGIDRGLRAPTVLIDSAIRLRGVVLENEGTLDFEFERRFPARGHPPGL